MATLSEPTEFVRVLRPILPDDLQPAALALAQILSAIVNGQISPAEAESGLAQDEVLRPVLQALAGREIASQSALISFGAGSQLGDVSIGDVAGHNLVKLTLVLGADAFNVAGLPNPYQGLRAFDYADRARYGGRRRLIAHTVQRLVNPGAQRSLLFITGDSGSGKSSFAQAGLIPELEAHYHGARWQVSRATMRPGPYPLAAMAAALRMLSFPPDGVFSPLAGLVGADYAEKPPAQTVGLLVCDQFEELFTQSDPEQRETLLAILATLPPFTALPLHVIITLRSDYLPELFAYARLYDEVKGGVELRAMSVEELIEAITCPLEQSYPHAGKRFDPALLELLAAEASRSGAYLPLLQVTLEDLWRRGNLTSGAHHTLTDAISRRAEDVYLYSDYDSARSHERTGQQRELVIDILLSLIDVSLDDDTRRDVRCRRMARDLILGSPVRASLIDDLCQARLLSKGVLYQGEMFAHPIDTVDIIHESLITNWARLRASVQERRGELQERARFEQALREWLAHGQHEDYLIAGVRLAEAEELARRGNIALRSDEARHLLDMSRSLRERARQRELEQVRLLAEAREKELALESTRRREQEQFSQRLQRRASELAAALVLAVCAAIAAGFLGMQAQRNAREAESQLQVARAEQARLEITSHPELALALTVAAASAHGASELLPIARALYTSFDQIALVHLLRADPDWIVDAAWSADASRVVTVGHNGAVRWWNSDTGQVLSEWQTATAPIAMALSAQGDRLLLSLAGRGIELYEPGASKPEPLSQFTQQLARKLAWNPAGDRVLVVPQLYDDPLCIWDLATGAQIQLPIYGAESLPAIAWGPDGAVVLVGDEQGIRVFQASNGHELTVQTQIGPVTQLAWSPASGRLMTGAADGRFRVWAAQVREEKLLVKEVLSHQAHDEAISTMSWSTDGQRALTGSVDGSVAMWAIGDNATELRRFLGGSWVVAAQWSSDGWRWLTADKAGMLRLWDLRQDARLSSPQVPPAAKGSAIITALAWSSGGLLAGGSASGELYLWDAETGALVTTLSTPQGGREAVALAWSGDGRRLAASFSGCTFVVWDVSQPGPLWLHSLPFKVKTIDWSDDGERLLTANSEPLPGDCAVEQGDTESALRVWNSLTGDEVWKQTWRNPLLAGARWWEGERRIVGVGKDGNVQVWDRNQKEPLWEHNIPTGDGSSSEALPTEPVWPVLALSATDQRVLIGSPDANSYLFDSTTGGDGWWRAPHWPSWPY